MKAIWWWRGTFSSGGGVIWWWKETSSGGGGLSCGGVVPPVVEDGCLVIDRYMLTLIKHIFHRLHSGLQVLPLLFILASRFNFVLKLPLLK